MISNNEIMYGILKNYSEYIKDKIRDMKVDIINLHNNTEHVSKEQYDKYLCEIEKVSEWVNTVGENLFKEIKEWQHNRETIDFAQYSLESIKEVSNLIENNSWHNDFTYFPYLLMVLSDSVISLNFKIKNILPRKVW